MERWLEHVLWVLSQALSSVKGLQAHREHQNVIVVPIINSVEIVKMVLF